jgi:hypothetical protein
VAAGFSVTKTQPKVNQGPGLSRAENGAADGGTVHAYCAGQLGSLDAFLHSDVEL